MGWNYFFFLLKRVETFHKSFCKDARMICSYIETVAPHHIALPDKRSDKVCESLKLVKTWVSLASHPTRSRLLWGNKICKTFLNSYPAVINHPPSFTLEQLSAQLCDAILLCCVLPTFKTSIWQSVFVTRWQRKLKASKQVKQAVRQAGWMAGKANRAVHRQQWTRQGGRQAGRQAVKLMAADTPDQSTPEREKQASRDALQPLHDGFSSLKYFIIYNRLQEARRPRFDLYTILWE